MISGGFLSSKTTIFRNRRAGSKWKATKRKAVQGLYGIKLITNPTFKLFDNPVARKSHPAGRPDSDSRLCM